MSELFPPRMGVPRRMLLGAVAVVVIIGAVVVLTRGYRPDPLPRPTPVEPPCDPRDSAPRRSPPSIPALRVIASELCALSAVAFRPDGSALVTERDTARVLSVTADGGVSEVQRLAQPVAGGGGGLLGIAVSPAYATDGWIYAYYTSEVDNRIARFRPGGVPEPILTGIPAGAVGNGGRIAFGPDGMLYAGTGDAGRPEAAGERDWLGGKILRLTPDGRPAPGNPYPRSPVWSLGHRDVRGLAWDREGRLYATDADQDGSGELNLIEAGGNYGTGFVGPVATWPGPASPGGIAVVAGTVYVACLTGERLRLVALAGQPHGVLLGGQYGRLGDVTAAPDGSLWILTSNRDGRGAPAAEDDRILRLDPSTIGGPR